MRAFNGLIYRVLDGCGRGSGELNEFVDVVFHVRLFIAAGRGFLESLFDRFTGFAGALLNAAQQLVVLAFGELEIVIRELGPLLFQLALGDVPVAFAFECIHNNSFVFRSCLTPT